MCWPAPGRDGPMMPPYLKPMGDTLDSLADWMRVHDAQLRTTR